MGEEKEILLRGNVCAYLTDRLMGDPTGWFVIRIAGHPRFNCVENARLRLLFGYLD
jgi:hypothetical protein